MKKMKKDKVIQVRCNQEMMDRIDRLKEKGLLSNRTEVIRKALVLYEFFIKELSNGYSVELVRGKTRKKVVLLD